MKALQDMEARALESLRRQAREAAALSLIAETGGASKEQIDERVSASFVEPSAGQLADQVAGKARAAVVFQERVAADAHQAVSGVKSKIEKYRALLDGVKAELEQAKQAAADADSAVEKARDILAHAAGNPANTRQASARATAQTASVSGKA